MSVTENACTRYGHACAVAFLEEEAINEMTNLTYEKEP